MSSACLSDSYKGLFHVPVTHTSWSWCLRTCIEVPCRKGKAKEIRHWRLSHVVQRRQVPCPGGMKVSMKADRISSKSGFIYNTGWS